MRLLVERVKTPIGAALITHDSKRLCNLAFEDREERRQQELAHHFPGVTFEKVREHSKFADALVRYFKGEVKAIEKLAVAPLGTEFQRRAWDELRRIPAGKTRGYGEQAATLGKPNAARAVGRANGLNPISIVIPCHRLIGANGSLVHYGGGLERKQWLIDHEARHAGRRA